MKSTSGKRATSRKGAKEPRGRKGQEEIEKQVSGAGWTAAATQHFMDLATDADRLQHIRAMFTISEDDYKYQVKSTFIVDFHYANGIYAVEQQYDVPRAQFICRSMTELLEVIISTAQQSNPVDVDNFRLQLLEKYQAAFFDFNTDDNKFTIPQAEEVLKFICDVMLIPIRLIITVFHQEPFYIEKPEARKVFQAPPAIPLAEFTEEFPLAAPGMEFVPPEFPKLAGLTLADVRDAMARYTDAMVATIDRRYDRLEELVTKASVM